MTITNSTIEDMEEIFRLYAAATEYQKLKFPLNQWPEFDRELIETEIRENRQYKLLIGKKIACVWAVTFSDPEIWEEKNSDPAIYIHRIATDPEFRGRNFVSVIVDWAKEYGERQGKEYIRLDTCGNNTRLIDHYKKSGFDFLGMKRLKNAAGLPQHYQNADVCYFEIRL